MDLAFQRVFFQDGWERQQWRYGGVPNATIATTTTATVAAAAASTTTTAASTSIVSTASSSTGQANPNVANPSNPNQLNITWGDKSIVYFTGPSIEPWGPKSLFGGLGGSETAVLHLSKHWSNMGYEVIIYGNFTEETLNGSYLKHDSDTSSSSNIKMSDWRNVKFLPHNIISEAHNLLR